MRQHVLKGETTHNIVWASRGVTNTEPMWLPGHNSFFQWQAGTGNRPAGIGTQLTAHAMRRHGSTHKSLSTPLRHSWFTTKNAGSRRYWLTHGYDFPAINTPSGLISSVGARLEWAKSRHLL
jgi:hypothetical protein